MTLNYICLLVFSEDLKPASPPKLEPTAPSPPPRQGEPPLEPPTLRPVSRDSRSPTWPCKRLKLERELSVSHAENKNCTKTQERSATPPPCLHSEAQVVSNGLPALGFPSKPTTGGVGRRTSVLFRKAKNGAKLFKERDNPVLNGKGPQDENTSIKPTAPSSSSTPTSTPLSTLSKTPQKSPEPPTLTELWSPGQDSCSDSELESRLESGEKVNFVPEIKYFYFL